MRSRLLSTASTLFRAKGLSAVSIAEIATDAEAFPSQITYYFRTKEALFVEAACREVLYAGRAAERQAGRQTTPEAYTRALVDAVTRSDALGFFVEAMVLTRRRQDLAPLIERTVERLHAEGLRAYAAEIEARGWRSLVAPEISARRFWSLAIGVTAEGQAMGRAPKAMAADLLRLVGAQADAAPAAGRRPGAALARDPGSAGAGSVTDGDAAAVTNIVRLDVLPAPRSAPRKRSNS